MTMITSVTVVDDLDGTSPADQTITFALDEHRYDIDLTHDHAADLREALRPYIEKARRAGKPEKPTRPKARRLHPETARDIRVWVRKYKGTVADKGRIPDRYVDAYYDNNPAALRSV